MFSEVGDTALVILVPEAEAVVGSWRTNLDPAAAEGMPAHITVLYPFIPADRIDHSVLYDIQRMGERHAPIPLEFAAIRDFPDVVWLDPGSDDCTRLLEDARATWPDQPPYGRSDLKVIPHLTVADGTDAMSAERAKTSLQKRLPFSAQVNSVALMVFDGQTWVSEQQFPLGGAASRT